MSASHFKGNFSRAVKPARAISVSLRAALAAVLVVVFVGGCEPPDLPLVGSTSPEPKTDEAHTSEDNVVVLGDVRVLREERQVQVEAQIVLRKGILEYLAVAEGGKEYESVLSLKCKPSELHAALLLVGCEIGDVPEETKGDYIGPAASQPEENPRSHIDIFVEWQEEGRPVRVRAEKLLATRAADGGSPQDTHWVFTGSLFGKDESGKEMYLADLEKSVIAVWYDPTAVINLPVPSADPYRSETYGFSVNKEILPASSRAKLVIQPHK